MTLAKKAKYEANRKDSPLSRINVTKEQLAVAPQITPILKEVPGGIALAFKAMRFSSEPLITAFLEKYDSLSKHDRGKLSVEAVALGAGIDIRHLWGEIMLAIREQSMNTVAVVAMNSHPAVMKKRVQYAKTRNGVRDRDALDTILGALPQPKGPTFIGKMFVGATKEEDSEKTEQFDDDIDVVFPDVSKMQERIQPMRQKVLQAGK